MIKHRKLFPEYNATLPCPDICVSTCPYGCVPYSDVYWTPPPLPQNSPSVSTKRGENISPFVIVIVTLLASCFVVITFYLLAVKFRSRWNFLRHRRGQPQATGEDFLDENHGPTAIDYPIWYINTIGLQPSVIDSIAVFRYKKGDSLIEGTECSVCLNEFQNDDTLRLLPKCCHAFHIPCIDTWLRSHINCPVCRAGIVSGIAATTPVASIALNSNNLSSNEDSQVQNLENGEVSSINQAREDSFRENTADTGEIIEAQQVDRDGQDVESGDVKVNKITKRKCASWVIEDSDVRRMMEVGKNEEKSVRRSVSVDSLLAPNVTVCLSECEGTLFSEDQFAGGDSSKNVCGNSRTVKSLDGSSLITQLLHKRPVRMKRSFSYSGRSLFSRQCSRSNLVLSLSSVNHPRNVPNP